MPTNTLTVVLQWLTHSLTSFELLHTIQTSMTRVCELVTAIKDYCFMDQAPPQTVNIHHGLESTLTILSYIPGRSWRMLTTALENLCSGNWPAPFC